MPLERFSAAWREGYVTSVSAGDNATEVGECVFCVLAGAAVDESSGVLWRSELSYVVLNAFPYGSGHLLVLPIRHLAGLSELRDDEYADFSEAIRRTVLALEKAYGSDGMNVGMNLGQAAGAGIPKHLHGHVLPRWSGDTNFMPVLSGVDVISQSLDALWELLAEKLDQP